MKDLPITYVVAPDHACDELDYTDMVALSGLFRRWAIYETSITPKQRTRCVQFSADYEQLAEWVGGDWRAANPSPEKTLLKFLATLERTRCNVTDFLEVRRAMKIETGVVAPPAARPTPVMPVRQGQTVPAAGAVGPAAGNAFAPGTARPAVLNLPAGTLGDGTAANPYKQADGTPLPPAVAARLPSGTLFLGPGGEVRRVH